jgi:hypothetical protein
METDRMDKKEGMNKWKSALLLGGGLAAALLWGCFNPIHAGITDGTDPGSADQGSENSGPADPGAGLNPGDGAAGEFTVVLRVGEGPEVPESRNAVGPGAEDIPYSGVCNTIQVIAVDAETQKVADNKQTSQKTENDSKTIWVNIAQGKRYHFLVLMGHRERDYEAEKDSGGQYVYKDITTDPPTLLAAGFLGDQAIHGQPTLSITMKPLVVDTVFEHGDRVTQAALPKTALPAEVAARVVWTLTGGFATLVDAQTRTGLPGGLNWGGLTLEEQETILRIKDKDDDINKDAVLGGAERNRIVLDLGTPTKGTGGSANFRLTYKPLGVDEGEGASLWIIRNGVNDLAQDKDTTFDLVGGKIPWGTEKNGNGAVAFSFEDQKISLIDLTDLIPAPVGGKAPKGSFDAPQYGVAVTWDPSADTFQIGQMYTATVTLTLKSAGGFFFEDGVKVVHSGASLIWGLSKKDALEVEVKVLFPKTGAVWEYGGYFSGSKTVKMDSAIDAIRAAQEAGISSLSLKLVPEPELAVDLGVTWRDIGGGLVLNSGNSPAAVLLDGGGKTISLTGGTTGSVITVGSGVTLTLRNITFVGLTYDSNDPNGPTTDNNVALIKVVDGGKLILENGAVITGNTNANANNNGGGVSVVEGAFTMRGGSISGNNVTQSIYGSGGGVSVTGESSTFEMSGGTISGNNTEADSPGYGGGGVYLHQGTFTMRGGTISGNKAIKQSGGGVLVYDGHFYMYGGIISGNKAEWYGGGVYVSHFTFIKKPEDGSSSPGGVIYGNDQTDDTLENTAKEAGKGHAVYYTHPMAGITKKKDGTSGSGDMMEGKGKTANGFD